MVEPCEEEGTSDDKQGERSVSRTIEERGVLIEMVMMSKIVSKVMLMMMDGWMDGWQGRLLTIKERGVS